MADVATAAGAEENGLASVTQAQVIATRFIDKQRDMVRKLLEKRISRDFQHLDALNLLDQYIESEKLCTAEFARTSTFARL